MLDINKFKPYLISSIIVLIFSQIYELFSHNVYSNYMTLAFLIPLVLGFIYVLFNNYINKYIYNLSVITLSIGSVIKGVLDIYGTTNNLIYVYLMVGTILILISIINNTRIKMN